MFFHLLATCLVPLKECRKNFSNIQSPEPVLKHPEETDKLLAGEASTCTPADNIISISITVIQAGVPPVVVPIVLPTCGAMNSIVLDLHSGLLLGSPYVLLTGS